jgi:glycosyltransferase involved in cell wall biosynthesis
MPVSSWLDCHIHNRLARYTLLQGCFSRWRTACFLQKLHKEQIDLIHLHNLHGSYINLSLLFRYIKKNRIRVIWTLHDCWSFTGFCPYFDMAGCDQWRTGCYRCPQFRSDPHHLLDSSRRMYRLKKQWFTDVEDMTLVTPSHWLAELVKQSYLRDYPVKVIHNGIDLSVFRPAPSDFRQRYGIAPEKKILLGVAFGWGARKGLDVFVELEKRLGNGYQIVLVGTDETVDKQLPKSIISIHRTENQQQLAQIYTAADLFVNPTREENYPTVNMEALACGTPVLTFRTGGSPEIPDATCGAVVEKDDVDAMEKEIHRICRDEPYSKEACLKRAECFDMNLKYKEYVQLYEDCTYCAQCTL